MEDSKTLEISLEDTKIFPEINPILKNLPKLRRQSNNFTCNLADTAADADNSESLHSCGSVCVYNLKQQLIFNCEFCDLKYGDLDNFKRHLHEAHSLFQLEEPVKENAAKNPQSSKDFTAVKKEPLEPPIDLPPTYFTEPLVSCGAVFIFNQQKFHLACGYCDCSKYDNLDMFEKHVKQQHNILEGAHNELNVVPKVEVKEEFLITEVVEPTELKVVKEEPLEEVVLDIKQSYSDDEEEEDEDENEESEDDGENEIDEDDEEFIDEHDEEFIDEDGEDEEGEEDETEDEQNTSKATKRKKQESPSDEPSTSSSAKTKRKSKKYEPTTVPALAYCEVSYQNRSDTKINDKLVECDICHKYFKNKYSLQRHLEIHSNEQHFCNICQKNFKTKRYLNSHMVAVHSEERPYECDICQMRFRVHQHLDVHKKKHLGEAGRNHVCEYCDKAFFRKFDMVVHQRIHTGERPYECNVCAKSFMSSAVLNEHTKIHMGEAGKMYNCEHCNMKFGRSYQLLQHKKVHFSVKLFECDICRKHFPSQKSLDTHKKLRHLEKGARYFECEHCDKKYFYNYELAAHERVHTGERPYKCDVCEKDFMSNSTLYDHKKTHMGEAEKIYSCDICDKKFARADGLFNHKYVHTSERPFECDVCHNHYKSKRHLHIHKKNQHEKEKATEILK